MSNVLLDAFYSLGKRINKVGGQDNQELQQGVVGEQAAELTLDMKNADLVKLTENWTNQWLSSEIYATWKKHWEENEKYYLGTQFDLPEISPKKATQDNVLFKALETWLPQVTQHNPEPLVTVAAGMPQDDGTDAYTEKLKLKLADIADELRLRLKLKKGARHWALYLVGAAKFAWNLEKNIPDMKVVRPQKLILDSNGCTDEDGYDGKYIGEHRQMEASKIIEILQEADGEEGAIDYVTKKAGGEEKLGTDMGFIEWWTPTYMCWVMNDQVLIKKKNPHWNYPKQVPVQPPMGAPVSALQPQSSEQSPGTPQEPPMQEIKGINHFGAPKLPYLLLSVFNLGKGPVDDTSLFTQNLSMQDLINRRIKQIDKNAASMNGGMVVAGDRSGLSQRQAKSVTRALRNGGTIWIPTGPVNEAINRMSAPALPADIYQQLNDARSELQYSFGVKGFEPVASGGMRAVRTQMINMQLDQARISGGFSEYLEQWADDSYNWFYQLLLVHDPEYNQQQPPKVKLTVKEGSLLPKDSAALAQQALELSGQGRMSMVDLYKRLEYPNPEEMAVNAWLEVNAPELLYKDDPRVIQAIQMRSQASQKPPSEAISFKDLPPDGKAQMAAQAGIHLHPEGIAAHDEFQKGQEQAAQQAAAQQNVQPQQ